MHGVISQEVEVKVTQIRYWGANGETQNLTFSKVHWLKE